MAYCTKCGNKMADDIKFCTVCGTKMPKIEEVAPIETQRMVSYNGAVYKCPNCGEVLPSFTSVCPTCHYEVRDISASKTINSLHEELQSAMTDERRILAVKTFPIPNSKEDILEFMILASSNIDADYYASHRNDTSLSAAWLSKMEQCYQKAQVVLTNDTGLYDIAAIYNETTEKIKKAQSKNLILKILPFALIGVGLVLIMTEIRLIQTVGLVFLGIGIFLLCKKKKSNSQQMIPPNYGNRP